VAVSDGKIGVVLNCLVTGIFAYLWLPLYPVHSQVSASLGRSPQFGAAQAESIWSGRRVVRQASFDSMIYALLTANIASRPKSI
jgi:hypothetical protein